jgi:hypothetical protein
MHDTIRHSIVMLVLVYAQTAIADDLIPVPATATQDAFIATVRESYAADLKAAKAPDDRTKLSDRLLKLASESKDDPASQFVLLKDARDLAVQAVDIEKAFKAVDQIAELFNVNAIELKVKVLQDASNAVRPREGNRSIASQGMELVQQAIAVDDFDHAESAAKLAIAAANRVPDAVLIKEAAAVVKEIPTLRTAYRQIQPALQVLVDNPADPTASVIVGKYYCLVKGDWAKGLPLLAIGNDASLKSLAELEVGQPTELEKQVEIGDKYWDLSATEQGLRKARLQEHAAEWYSKAVASLTGITKAKVEKRVADVAKLQNAKAPVAATNRFNGPRTLGPFVGKRIDELEVAKWIISIGGKVNLFDDPQRAYSTAEDAAKLPTSPLIGWIDASDTTLSSAELNRLSGLSHLQGLNLTRSQIKGTGLGLLAQCPKLSAINLSGCDVSDADIAELVSITSLKHLELRSVRLSGNAIRSYVAKMKLQILAIDDAAIVDQDLAALSSMNTLANIGLRGTGVTNAGIQNLPSRAALLSIDIRDTGVSDEGLIQLGRFSTLKNVILTGRNFSQEGIERFRKMLPNCIVATN